MKKRLIALLLVVATLLSLLGSGMPVAAEESEAAAEVIVTPAVTDAPVLTPEVVVTPEVTVAPVVTPEVTEEPVVTPEATEEPEVTPAVTEEPAVTPEVTPAVTEEPKIVVEEKTGEKEPLLADGGEAETVCEICGEEECICETEAGCGNELCTCDPCLCEVCECKGTFWDPVKETIDLPATLIYLNQSAESIRFFDDDGDECFVSPADCPAYLVANLEYRDAAGNVLFYQTDSFDDDFWNEVVGTYCYVVPSAVSAVVPAAGMYATVSPDAGEIWLFKDTNNATDIEIVTADQLSGEYRVADFVYAENVLGYGQDRWCVQLVADETWPVDDNYTWLTLESLATLTRTPTHVPDEPDVPDVPEVPGCGVCGKPDCDEIHMFCSVCNKYDCGKVHASCPVCGDMDCEETHAYYYPDLTAPIVPKNVEFAVTDTLTISDELGNEVGATGIQLGRGMQRSLSAWTNLNDVEGVSYQWQVRYDHANNLWADILGETGKGILFSAAMFQNIAVNGIAVLRCVATVDGVERCSEPVSINLKEAPVAVADKAGKGGKAGSGSDVETNTITVTISFLFTSNTIVTQPFVAEIPKDTAYTSSAPYEMMDILGYAPVMSADKPEWFRFDSTNNSFTLNISAKDAEGDLEYTVLYHPQIVNVSVEHHLQNVNDNNYTKNGETETLRTFKTGETVENVHRTAYPSDTDQGIVDQSYKGFYNLAYENPIAAADGSTHIKIKYNRYYYLLSFDLDGGFGARPVYARYGAPIDPNDVGVPERPGYTFVNWATANGRLPATMPNENTVISANWSDPQIVNYTIAYWCENADDNGFSLWATERKTAQAGRKIDGTDNIRNINGIDDEAYFTYSATLTDKQVEIEGDGSTVINVYYTRNWYTIYFKGISRTCVMYEHSHTDGTCKYTVLCGNDDHDHTAECNPNLVCSLKEHTHGSSCVCLVPPHTHSNVCCTVTPHTHDAGCCTKDPHAAHTNACYNDVGTKQNNAPNGAPSNPSDGQIYRASRYGNYYGQRYIFINGSWYRYNGDENSGTISPNCGGLHTHGTGCTYDHGEHTHGTDCSCDTTVHTHGDGKCVYDHGEHTHSEACYTYTCGESLHEHTSACYGACEKYEHSHTTRNPNCSSDSTDNVIWVIHAKYNAYIGNVWPTVDKFPGTNLYGWSNLVNNQTTVSMRANMTSDLCATNGKTATAAFVGSGYTERTLHYMLESFDQETNSNTSAEGLQRRKVGTKWYDEDKAYTQKVLSNTTEWNQKAIYGATAVTNNGVQNENNGTDIFFYYNRNRDTIVFYNTNTGTDDPTLVTINNVMFGTPIGDIVYNGKPLSSYALTKEDYPSGLEPKVYVYDGWYTTAQGLEGTRANLDTTTPDTMTMPDGKLELFAKWLPITRHVYFYLDEASYKAGKTIPEELPFAPYKDAFATLDIPNGRRLAKPYDPGVAQNQWIEHRYKDYNFIGWFYVDDNGKEQAFDPNDMEVLQDLRLYAKWVANDLVKYNFYFALDVKINGTNENGSDGIPDVDANGNIIYVADPISDNNLAGQTVTIEAKGGIELYEDYRNGYFPNVKGHSLTLALEDKEGKGVNSYTFLYKYVEAVPYEVRYMILNRTTGVYEPYKVGGVEYVKTYPENRKAIVTETFLPIENYMPDEFQKTIIVSSSGENVITFYYEYDTEHAYYQINHYGQSIDGKGWMVLRSEVIEGTINKNQGADNTKSATKTTFKGFTFSDDDTVKFNLTDKMDIYGNALLAPVTFDDTSDTVSGELTTKGLQLNLYYTRNQYAYKIRYVRQGNHEDNLFPEVNRMAYYEEVIFAEAPGYSADIDGDDVAEDFAIYEAILDAQNRTISDDVSKNTILFEYARAQGDLAVTKKLMGPGKNTGPYKFTLDPHADNINGFHKTMFHYTIVNKNGDKVGEGELVPRAFANGDKYLEFELYAGQTIRIEDLPTAKYTITELGVADRIDDGYTADLDPIEDENQDFVEVLLTKDCEFSKGTQLQVTAINTYHAPKLFLSKDVEIVEEGGNTPELNQFAFGIRMPAGIVPDASYTYNLTSTHPVTGDPVVTTLQATPALYHETINGTEVEYYKMNVYLADGEYLMFETLPIGTYTIEESDYAAEGYKARFVVNDVAPLAETTRLDVQLVYGETVHVKCINDFPVGDLDIEKIVQKAYAKAPWDGDTFTFRIQRTDKALIEGNKYAVKLNGVDMDPEVVEKDANGTYIEIQIPFTKPDADSIANGGQIAKTLRLMNLPEGYYTVTEIVPEKFTANKTSVENLKIPAGEVPKASFTNTLKRTTGNMKVSKTIIKVEEQVVIDPDQEFTFLLKLKDAALTTTFDYEVRSSVDHAIVSGAYVPVLLSDGTYQFKLKHQQYILIKDLPIGDYILMEEAITGYQSSFGDVLVSPGQYTADPAVVTEGETAEYHCQNRYPVYNAELTVKKTVDATNNSDDDQPDANDSFTVKVSVSGYGTHVNISDGITALFFASDDAVGVEQRLPLTKVEGGEEYVAFELKNGQSYRLNLPECHFKVEEIAMTSSKHPGEALTDHYEVSYVIGSTGDTTTITTPTAYYLASGKEATVNVTNTYKSHYADLIIEQVRMRNPDPTTNSSTESAVYHLLDKNGNVVVTFAMCGNTEVVLEKVPVGTYSVMEIASDWTWAYNDSATNGRYVQNDIQVKMPRNEDEENRVIVARIPQKPDWHFGEGFWN